jgi:hypothetical protein
MSQVNCVKHSVKQLRYVAHDVSLQGQCAVPLDVQGGSLSLTSSSNSLVYVWELCYLRGTWVPYPQDTCLALEGLTPLHLHPPFLLCAYLAASFLL